MASKLSEFLRDHQGFRVGTGSPTLAVGHGVLPLVGVIGHHSHTMALYVGADRRGRVSELF